MPTSPKELQRSIMINGTTLPFCLNGRGTVGKNGGGALDTRPRRELAEAAWTPVWSFGRAI